MKNQVGAHHDPFEKYTSALCDRDLPSKAIFLTWKLLCGPWKPTTITSPVRSLLWTVRALTRAIRTPRYMTTLKLVGIDAWMGHHCWKEPLLLCDPLPLDKAPLNWHDVQTLLGSQTPVFINISSSAILTMEQKKAPSRDTLNTINLIDNVIPSRIYGFPQSRQQ